MSQLKCELLQPSRSMMDRVRRLQRNMNIEIIFQTSLRRKLTLLRLKRESLSKKKRLNILLARLTATTLWAATLGAITTKVTINGRHIQIKGWFSNG